MEWSSLECWIAGDEIHVRSHINAVPYLALAMEQCWLSDSPHPSSHARTQDTRYGASFQ